MRMWLVRFRTWLFGAMTRLSSAWVPGDESHRRGRVDRLGVGEEGQTTAEYALVILAAAAIAIVLIAWARSSGKLPAFFDKIIDDITNNAQ
jgi:Flp pilus assembly pilin Flp